VEFPHLVELYNTYKSQGFTVVAVDGTNRPHLAAPFIKETKAAFPVLMDDKDVAGGLYAIKGYPTTFMIDKEGRIIFRHLGFAEGKEKAMEREIQLLLKGELAQAAGE